jgi:hypothetical protein
VYRFADPQQHNETLLFSLARSSRQRPAGEVARLFCLVLTIVPAVGGKDGHKTNSKKISRRWFFTRAKMGELNKISKEIGSPNSELNRNVLRHPAIGRWGLGHDQSLLFGVHPSPNRMAANNSLPARVAMPPVKKGIFQNRFSPLRVELIADTMLTQ